MEMEMHREVDGVDPSRSDFVIPDDMEYLPGFFEAELNCVKGKPCAFKVKRHVGAQGHEHG